jgi:hypothetical protein
LDYAYRNGVRVWTLWDIFFSQGLSLFLRLVDGFIIKTTDINDGGMVVREGNCGDE